MVIAQERSTKNTEMTEQKFENRDICTFSKNLPKISYNYKRKKIVTLQAEKYDRHDFNQIRINIITNRIY